MECGTPGGRIAATLQSSPSKTFCVPACAPSPDKARLTIWLRTLSLLLFMARLLLARVRHPLWERVAGPPPKEMDTQLNAPPEQVVIWTLRLPAIGKPRAPASTSSNRATFRPQPLFHAIATTLVLRETGKAGSGQNPPS